MTPPRSRLGHAVRTTANRLAAGLSLASRLGLLEIRTLMVVLLLTGAAWAFVEIADEVVEGEALSFDETVLLAMRVPGNSSDPIGPPWFEEAARDVTALGGLTVLLVVTVSSAVYMLMARRPRMALLLTLSVLGAQILNSALKLGFARPRPDLVAHQADVYTASFPSGHSMMAAATFLTLGALLSRVQSRRRQKAFLLGLAIVLALLVGLSRIYLGVHWPTDVLGGWTVGAGWAALVWLVAHILQRIGLIGNRSGETEIPPATESSARSDVT